MASTSPTASVERRRWGLLQHFDLWLDTLDGDMREAMTSPSTWFGVAVLAGLVIAGAGLAPGKEIFHLDMKRAVWSFIPTILPGLCLGLLERKRRVSLRTFGLWSVLGSSLFQFFMWSLVTLSEPPGAPMMASFPLLLAGFHGYAFRSSPEHPYIALGVACGGALALGHRHDTLHLAIFAVSMPVALGISLVLGHIAQQGNLARLDSIRLREAVDAQVLSERIQYQEVLAGALLRLRGTHHDAGNALSGALFNLEQLALETRKAPLDERRCRNIGQMAQDLGTSLERLRKLLLDAKVAGEIAGPGFEDVELGACVQPLIDEARTRFPRVNVLLAWPAELREAAVVVCGGATTLERILSNVIANACEGNGVRAATRVELRASESPDGVLLELVDDGPGFSEQRLRSPFRAFQTTKAGGSGLGLYTSNRLVLASGGRLSLSNLPGERGALVQIDLRTRVER